MKRLQNKVAESRLTLPVTILLVLPVWIAAGHLGSREHWLDVGCLLVSTALMMELNNTNALIRIYSRLVSCSFLVYVCVANFLLVDHQSMLVQTCFVAFYTFFFKSYHDRASQPCHYYAAVAIGIGSLFFPQILFFVPVAWLLAAVYLQSLSIRTFCASVLGLITPYWFAVVYMLLVRDFSAIATFWSRLTAFDHSPFPESLSTNELLTLAFVVVLTLAGIIHFILTSYKDKIHIRMLYYTMMMFSVCFIAYAVVQPQHFRVMLALAIVNASTFTGHLFALTSTKASNIFFFVTLLLALLLTVYNLIA